MSYQNQVWTKNYAISKDEIRQDLQDFSYSAIFEFEGDKKDPTILHVTGRGMCPQAKLSDQILQFGEANVNEHREIQFKIENRNKDISLDVNVPRIPYFHLQPSQTLIEPGMTGHFLASF